MTIATQIVAALGPLVANRVYPMTFQQEPDTPTWPAIRFTFTSLDPGATLCGSGSPSVADVGIQVDVVAETFDGMRTLAEQVQGALASMATPCLWEAEFDTYDFETKTFRAVMQFTAYPSSAT